MSSLALAIVAAIVLSGGLASILYRQAATVARPGSCSGGVCCAISNGNTGGGAYTLARTRFEFGKPPSTPPRVVWLTVLLGPLYTLVAQFVAPACLAASACDFVLARRAPPESAFSFSALFRSKPASVSTARLRYVLLDRIKAWRSRHFLASLALWLFLFWLRVLPDFWWLTGWAAFMVLMIAMTVIYPFSSRPCSILSRRCRKAS